MKTPTEKTEIKWLKMYNDLINSGKCYLDAINEVVRQGQLESKESVICTICKKPITETGTAYKCKPVHIGCYHKVKSEQKESVGNEWISVEDELPKNNKMYLVFNTNAFGNDKRDVARFDTYNQTWFQG